MVQFVFTPWRSRQELLAVRDQFYLAGPQGQGSSTAAGLDTSSDAAAEASEEEGGRRMAQWEAQHGAVARVSMWMQRGNCPHLVESTALLMAAILDDEGLARRRKDYQGSSTYAVRAAYSTAFSRFVTGLLDMQQDKQRKMSMFSVAKTIGLPATFVELRHQATHEQLPSLARLRSAAKKALAWIWDYYWQHLTERDPSSEEEGEEPAHSDPCRDSLVEYLGEAAGDAGTMRQGLRTLTDRWGHARVASTLMDLSETAQNSRLLLRSLQLSRELMQSGDQKEEEEAVAGPGSAAARDVDAVRAEMAQLQRELATKDDAAMVGNTETSRSPSREGEGDVGWSLCENWVPKPIGVA